MRQKQCLSCDGMLEKKVGKHKGVEYSAYRCAECGEQIMDFTQAMNYMDNAEKSRQVTFSKWGQSIAIRIPVEIARAFKIKIREKARIITEKDGFKVIPA